MKIIVVLGRNLLSIIQISGLYALLDSISVEYNTVWTSVDINYGMKKSHGRDWLLEGFLYDSKIVFGKTNYCYQLFLLGG